MATCPKKLVEFTEADGADLHCELKAAFSGDVFHKASVGKVPQVVVP